jgi:DNA replication protein DnaC
MKGQVDIDRARNGLERLGMRYAAEAMSQCLNTSVKEDWPPYRLLDEIIGIELRRREEERIKKWLRTSNLPPGQTLGNFDWTFQPSIKKSQIEGLATCAWIREHQVILFQGPPGTGKTHLSVALGVKAIGNGFTVVFYQLQDLLPLLKKDADLAPKRLRAKKYMKVSLLIVDELGFQPMDREEASLFFRLVNCRYTRGSLIITTNKSVRDWPEIMAGDEIMTTALLDRLLHHCHVINIKGRSYRLKELEKVLK